MRPCTLDRRAALALGCMAWVAIAGCVVNPIPTPWTSKSTGGVSQEVDGKERFNGEGASADASVGAMVDGGATDRGGNDSDPTRPPADASATTCDGFGAADGSAAPDSVHGGRGLDCGL